MKRTVAVFLALLTLFLASCNTQDVPEIPPATVEPDVTAEPESTVPESDVTPPETVDTLPPETDPPAPVCSAEILGIELISSATGKPYENCTVAVDGDVITFGYPLIAVDGDVHHAKLRFITDGAVDVSDEYDLNLRHEITLTDGEGLRRTYTLVSERLSYGVPVMEIYTNNSAPILTKTDYVHGIMYIDGERYPMKIRGRGNASWTTFPKKSYRIKLTESEDLFGLGVNKDWVLTSNYADKSLIRNAVAHDIAATLDGLEFTSTHILVNLYLNGEYLGVYTFADKIEEGHDRLDFSPKEGDTPSAFGGLDIGFLCEIGWDFDGENVYNKDYFDAQKVLRIYVKEPEIPYANTPELTYVREYILAMERAIVAGEGWQDYIDMDSWVDWFIATELTYNMESAYYRSCYMWKRQGGKLMMGPVWDFDMALGNHYGDDDGYDNWCTTESSYVYIMENWMNYMLTYEEFTDAIRERWNEMKDTLLSTANQSIDRHAAALDGSQQQNFIRWNIMKQHVGAGAVDPYLYDTYEKQVQYLRDFINARWAYMDERINREF